MLSIKKARHLPTRYVTGIPKHLKIGHEIAAGIIELEGGVE